MKKMTELIALRCTPELKEAVWEEAERRKVTPTNLIRMALSDLVTPGPRPDPNRPVRDV